MEKEQANNNDELQERFEHLNETIKARELALKKMIQKLNKKEEDKKSK